MTSRSKLREKAELVLENQKFGSVAVISQSKLSEKLETPFKKQKTGSVDVISLRKSEAHPVTAETWRR
jgi:hypothetical protein